MIEQFTSPVLVNNSQELWLVGEGVVVSGGAAGVAIPSLDFNFITGGLPGTVTFTRASNATQFNSAGTLVYAPHNLILDSEDWSTASWNRLTCTFSYNAATAPNDTLTADLLIPNNGSTIGRTTQFVSTLPDLISCVLSVYVKASGLTNVIIQVVDKSNTTQSSQTLNLSTGALSGSIDAGTTTTVTDVGNGWYRLSFAITSISSGATTPVWIIRCSSTGNGTDGILLWGAQLNVGSLQSYNQTTSSAYYGPRFDYNPATLAAQGLLIEESRTNSIRNNTMQGAVAGTPGTLPQVSGSPSWSASLAGGLSREVIGVSSINGINYIDIRILGTTTNTNLALNLYFELATQIAAVTGQTWSESAWVQMVGGSTTGISQVYFAMTEISSGGADLGYLTGTNFLSTIGTFTRRTYTATTANASTAFIRPALWVAHTGIGAAIDITLRIGLPQLELGAFATSVIPTTTTALTRSADVASVNTLAPWYNATEGTLYCEGVSNASSVDATNLALSDGTNSNRIQFGTGASNTVWDPFVVVSGSAVATLTQSGSFSPKTNAKLALAYKVDDFAAATSGASPVTDTSGAVPTVNILRIGASGAGVVTWNSWIRRITYYPRKLSSAELQAITA